MTPTTTFFNSLPVRCFHRLAEMSRKAYQIDESSLNARTISCLKHICGMLPFVSVDTPDQFYRLFTSLCLHAGVLHLAITITFQHVFLSDLERLLGPVRTAILYIGSGLAGNLTSAILVPYKPEVGPLASLSGVIASFSVLLILIHWKQLCKPHIALCKLICITAILFGIGTLPLQLNFAGLLAGAFCGMFLTVALLPFVSITEYGRKAKIKLIWSCVIFHLFIYSTLFLIFYLLPTELTGLNTAELVKAKLYTNPGSSGSGTGNVIVGVEVGTFGIESSHSSSLSDIPFRSFVNNKSRNIYGDEKKNQYFSMQQQRQYYYHHRYSEMMTGSAICDPSLKILNVNAKFPGASHDSFIWSSSAARRVMQRSYESGNHNMFLIGDSGYPLEPWLMAPLPNQPEGTPKFRYNEALCKSRNPVERLFGVLKWRCLSRQRVLVYEPGFAGKIINACATLHNIRLGEQQTDFDDRVIYDPEVETEIVSDAVAPSSIAKRVQERLIANFF